MPYLSCTAPWRRLAVAFALTGLTAAATAAGTAGKSPSPTRTADASALAQRHGCLGCHAAQTALVGPAYQAVAERYAGQADAAAAVAQHIREGGSGRWGAMAMPPQPQVTAEEARRLAAWILAGVK